MEDYAGTMSSSTFIERELVNDQEKKAIRKKLEERILNLLVCPMCSRDTFTILEWYGMTPLSHNMKINPVNIRSIPSVIIVCKNCGFISQHATGPLGLTDDTETAGG